MNIGVKVNKNFTPEEQAQADSANAAYPESPARADSFSFKENSEQTHPAREEPDWQALLLRRQAEFENYRRRTERERAELSELAATETIKAILPALDDFERALKTESSDKKYAYGMKLIYNRLEESLRKLGLEPISNEAAIFNPHIHDAVETVSTQDHRDQTVLDVFRKGYYFKGRLLRPALVRVAVNQ